MEATLTQRILKVISDEADVPLETVTPKTYIHGLIEDSLDYICLINELRLTVGPIPNKAASSFSSVQDILDFYEKAAA